MTQSVEIGEAVIYQRLKEESVILELGGQTFYSLDPVATDMWELLLKHGEVETVIRKLTTIYQADEEVLRHDLGALIEAMIEAQLLRRVDACRKTQPSQ
jgi:hypothetical protein